MRKTKKQLLGIAGLAAVGVMTAVACAMPTPNAAAVSGNAEDGYAHGYDCNDEQRGNECARDVANPSSSENPDGGTKIEVAVIGKPDVRTDAPANGSKFINPEIEVSTYYSEVMSVEYYLTYEDAEGNTIRVDLDTFTPTDARGTHKFTINIADYGYGDFTLHTMAKTLDGAYLPKEDANAFEYSAINATFMDETADNNDPILKVEVNSDVDKLIIYVYDSETGDPLFVDGDGKDVPIVLGRDSIKNDNVLVTLPFEQYGAPAGKYEAIVIANNDKGSMISVAEALTDYRPFAPDVPNSGAGFLASLNITQADYLLTGLIAFGLVAGFALYLVCRKNRS